MYRALTIEPARPEERRTAFRLAFRHLGEEDRDARVVNALGLLRNGELDPDGVIVARHGTRVLGAMVCLPVPGASALVWPPQAMPDVEPNAIEDDLVRYASAWLRRRGAKLAQALLIPEDAALAAALERNGFEHITGLWYLRRDVDLTAALLAEPERLAYRPYQDCEPALFHDTLLRTYVETQDCPEVNGVRTIEEILAGHRAQGCHAEPHWWLALAEERPAGVLLLADVPDWESWDIAYVGVVPEARRRGLGRELIRKALLEARAAEIGQLTLSVDGRNRPAWELYQGLGFVPFDRREVYLAIWR